MLQAEGERFAGSLAAAGKRVCYKKVSRVPHGWDKSPGVIAWGEEAAKGREKVAEVYMEVCGVLGAILGIKAKVVDEILKEGRRGWLWRRGSKKNGKDRVMTVHDKGTEKEVAKKSKEHGRRSKEAKRKGSKESLDELERREARHNVEQARKVNDVTEEDIKKTVDLRDRESDKSTVHSKRSKSSLRSKVSKSSVRSK